MTLGTYYKHCVHCTPCHMPFHATPCSYVIAIREPLDFGRTEEGPDLINVVGRTELCKAGRRVVDAEIVREHYERRRRARIHAAEVAAKEIMEAHSDPRDAVPDYEQFERNQLDADRDAGEFVESDDYPQEDAMVDLALENEPASYDAELDYDDRAE